MSYVMPKAVVGDWVLFYPHKEADPVPALVVTASSRTLNLVAFGIGGPVDKPSAHHVDDPGVEDFPDWKRYGYWEHKRQTDIAALSERVSLLERKVGLKKAEGQ
jgi:hypothetical protein